MSDKIIIVGFVQCMIQFDGFDLPKTNSIVQGQEGGEGTEESIMDSLPHHYLLTDTKGIITCLTEGFWKECGLHCKFFDYSNTFQ